jgi:TRAP transporter 4TM/12TM fusion protein
MSDQPAEILSEEKTTTFDESNRVLRGLIAAGGAGITLFIVSTMLFYPLPAMMQRAGVLMLSLFIIFMQYPLFPKRKALAWIDWLWAALSIVVCAYVLWDFEDLVNRMGDMNDIDKVMATLCVIMVLDATRRSIGWPLPIVTGLFLAYASFGSHLSGNFGHRGYDVHRILNQMYMTTEGVFGIPLGVVVTIVFLFILFGTFLERSGGGQFFINLAVSLAGRLRGGPAKIAVIASGLMGMISGSSIANVATVGTFTIPLMKRVGYRPEFAGAVESAAATGGQIMPPVLGAAAFIMSEFTHTPYLTIVVLSIVPACLYYLSLFMNVHFEACRTGLEGMPEEEIPKTSKVLADGWIFILPVVTLIVVLTMGYSPARAAFSAMGLLIVTSFLKSSTRIGPKIFWESLVSAGRNTVGIAAACACAGIIVGTVSMTGLGIKFANLIEQISQGHLIFALMFTAVASLVLGMALPTTANYIVQASVAAPALVALGMPVLTAHMFVFYFGVFADITPPVALAAYTAAGIAKGDPMKTGAIATRCVIVGFIVPFLFVYHPGLILRGPLEDMIMMIPSTALAVIALSAFVGNYLQRGCTVWERFALLASGILLITPGWVTDLAGLVLLVLVFLWQRKRGNAQAAPAA